MRLTFVKGFAKFIKIVEDSPKTPKILPVILASGIFFNVNQASKYSLVPRILQSLANVGLITECDDSGPPTLYSAPLVHNPYGPHHTSSLFVLSR